MEWWWFLIIGGILLITVVIIIIIVFCVCRRRRKSRKSNDNDPPKSLEKRAPKMKTAISKESPPKEKSKEKKKTKTKTKTKEEEADENKKSEKPKQAKPAKKNIDELGLESFQPPPKGKLMPFSKEDNVSQSDKRSAIQQASTQNDPTVEAAATTQETAPEIGTAENAGVHPVLRACAALKDE
uniref:Uncharacterized protein n=1 Tax=Panagrolaimus sp. ES5 TaxID=591445 RepID=A0AC34G6T8_9BILA